MITTTNKQKGARYCRKILPKDAAQRNPNIDFVIKPNAKKLPSRIYNCSECPENFNAYRQLKSHEIVHEGSVANLCQYCRTLFANGDALEKHKKACHETGKYKCPPCGKEYSNKGHLLKHTQNVHQRKTLLFYCSACFGTASAVNFVSRIELQRHFQQAHLSASIEEDDMEIEMNEEFLDEFLLSNTNENSFQFSECWEALDLHLPDMLRLPTADNSHNQNASQNIAAFKCPKCYEDCTSQKTLLLHLADRHALKVLICSKCEASFENLGQLRQHKATRCLRDISKNMKKPDICERALSESASGWQNEIHDRIVVNVQHVCPYCGKNFSAAANFKKHLRIVHSLLKRHICQLCDKQFATLDHLKKHVLSQHQNERKHLCDVCNKRFTQLCHLKQHLIIHTAGKTLQCELCEATFWRKIDLERHSQNTHD